MLSITIDDAFQSFLDTIKASRSTNTYKTYKNGMRLYKIILENNSLSPDIDLITKLSEDSISWFAADLKSQSPATERLYLTAVTAFFEYLAAESLSEINLPRIKLLIRQRARRPGIRLPQFPNDDIEKLLNQIDLLASSPTEDHNHYLINLRDRAFLITLADTGLRVHEACKLTRGDIDWNEQRAIVIGKGNREDIVRFSERAILALRKYLQERQKIDGTSGRELTRLPLFSRHDKGKGQKTTPLTTTSGRNIVQQRVKEILGAEAVGTITPHSFRHFFVTKVLRGSGNLKLAQELARHRNIAVTQRYAHLSNDELDRGYFEIFEESKKEP
ncbi:MAG TPA: tyrosine-type recombinase/integrase [Bellilinea sp.]|nr:tyrosine-type recombinase/integrase [Bellilinea sp.]